MWHIVDIVDYVDAYKNDGCLASGDDDIWMTSQNNKVPYSLPQHDDRRTTLFTWMTGWRMKHSPLAGPWLTDHTRRWTNDEWNRGPPPTLEKNLMTSWGCHSAASLEHQLSLLGAPHSNQKRELRIYWVNFIDVTILYTYAGCQRSDLKLQ